jgi:RNA polymerase sigma-70 factor (ECF subfamily)
MTDGGFRQAFREHKDAVYAFAFRMTGSASAAEDVAQDCFLELLRYRDRFDKSRGSLRSYLLGVTRNLALKRWRAEHRLDPLDDQEIRSIPIDWTSGETSLRVREAVQSLPPLQREAVVLFEYEGLTLEEIAGVSGVDVGTVKSRLHRAREKLRHLLAPLRNAVGGH